MRMNNKISLNTILQHKEYFDQKLVDLTYSLQSEIFSLKNENNKIKSSNSSLCKTNSSLHKQINLLKVQNRKSDKICSKLQKENEDLLKKIEELQRLIDEQKEEIDKQGKNIEKFEKIINKIKHTNSTNSNNPSSMDCLGHSKPKTLRSSRKRTGVPRGAQNGHPVHKSQLLEKADKVIELKVKKAPSGAAAVYGNKKDIQYYATQEVDILIRNSITETRYYIDENGKELDKEVLSRYAINPLTYSGNFKAAVVYLNQKGTIPLQRLSEMMTELSKNTIQLRPGTISKWCRECHKKSLNKREDILKDILDRAVVHVDETGMKVNGRQHWIHTITNERGAYFIITKKRGDDENGPVSKLMPYTGSVVHDHFSSYQKLKLCTHAECNAHIDRYMRNGIDFDKSKECEELLNHMHEILHKVNELKSEGKSEMSEEEIKRNENKYLEIIDRGLSKYNEEHSEKDKKYEPEYMKTFRRLKNNKDDHLRFMTNFEVPYTNNKAEKQCRTVKGKKNVSCQFITKEGGDAYVSILTLLQTAKIRKQNAFETLCDVFQ